MVMVIIRERQQAISGTSTDQGSQEGPIKLILANVGDCRAVLSDAGVCGASDWFPDHPHLMA